jgi:lipopolysaccharide export LptBFGC system permease protein LptF
MQSLEQKTQLITIIIAGVFSFLFTLTCCFSIVYTLINHIDNNQQVAFTYALTVIAYWMPSPARLMQPLRTATTTTTLAMDTDDNDRAIAQVSQKP